MFDPDIEVQKAIYAAVTTPVITLGDQVVPVYSHVPSTASAPYILLSQVSTAATSGAMACKYAECVFQLTILTSFPDPGIAYDLPIYTISGQVVNALDGKKLPLADGYSMRPLVVDYKRNASRYNNNSLEVLRYIRVKTIVFKNK
ncbi:DUF3168 domain-containing protein [Hymenobacter sublimis]|uniref:DUF3168 domain-containing protein n=1 Tax=Hymenobacter sublimis TaxID=2933777 RepID=A0ABY4JCI6_9BACT|nr:DUF3168 domain-containing protein [Hymenobacter sublimis]UPL50528.1 DUF3168 domain-containing protein [Hymenobacter sublimis]